MSKHNSNDKKVIRFRLTTPLLYIALTLWTVVSLFPFYFTLSTSFKLKRDVIDPGSWLFTPTLSNYSQIFDVNNFLFYIRNSAIVAVGSVVPSILLGLLAAYGMTRFGIAKERSIATTILSFRMIPAIAVVIPFFLIAQMLKIIDTHALLITAYLTMNLPLAIWMLRGFMRDIPIEIDEAAQLDGARPWTVLWRIHVAIVLPGITSTAILLFIQSWNEFVFAQFLTSSSARTFPTTVSFFISIAGTSFGQMAAAAIVGTLPVLLFAIFTRRQLVSGLSYGAV